MVQYEVAAAIKSPVTAEALSKAFGSPNAPEACITVDKGSQKKLRYIKVALLECIPYFRDKLQLNESEDPAAESTPVSQKYHQGTGRKSNSAGLEAKAVKFRLADVSSGAFDQCFFPWLTQGVYLTEAGWTVHTYAACLEMFDHFLVEAKTQQQLVRAFMNHLFEMIFRPDVTPLPDLNTQVVDIYRFLAELESASALFTWFPWRSTEGTPVSQGHLFCQQWKKIARASPST